MMMDSPQNASQTDRIRTQHLGDGSYRWDAISYRQWSIAALMFVLVGIPDRVAFAADSGIERRLEVLERQVEALSSRMEAMEQSASVPAQSPQTTALSSDGIVWTFDEYVNASPFEVSYKSFDRKSGSVELLLLVTAPIEQPDRWSVVGRRVPVALWHRDADGTESTAIFSLKRGTHLEPGARLHIETRVDPAMAAAIHHLRIGRSND